MAGSSPLVWLARIRKPIWPLVCSSAGVSGRSEFRSLAVVVAAGSRTQDERPQPSLAEPPLNIAVGQRVLHPAQLFRWRNFSERIESLPAVLPPCRCVFNYRFKSVGYFAVRVPIFDHASQSAQGILKGVFPSPALLPFGSCIDRLRPDVLAALCADSLHDQSCVSVWISLR